MNITELNALHYSAAVILTGTQKTCDNNPKDRPDPDEIIKKKIEQVRKWIGRLTMANRDGSSNMKIKNILKGQSIKTKLQNNKMKLAALTKKLRTRKTN